MAQPADVTSLSAVRTRRKNRLRLIVGGLIVVLLIGGGFVWKAQAQKKGKNGAVKTDTVKRGTIVQKISSTGAVTAETGADVKIGSQITGRIARLYADVGNQVKAGQVIAQLDAPDLQANLQSARSNAAAATTKYQQQLAGVSMQRTQTRSAFEQASATLVSARAKAAQARTALTAAQSRVHSAQSAVIGADARKRSAEAKLRSAQAASSQQNTQGNSDVARAKAALSTAQANMAQTEKSSDTLVANAVTALKQAQANASLAATNLKRQQNLLQKGYVPQSDVDTAITNRDNTVQIAEAAQNSLDAARAQARAQVQSARDAVDQAKASLEAAQASSYTSVMRTEDVQAAMADLADAKEGVRQADLTVETAKDDVATARSQVNSADSDVRSAIAGQKTALGNMTQDKIKQQDVQSAYEAMKQAQAQVAYQEAQYDKSNIRTPISGTVISLTQQQGETVAAGLSAPTLVEVAALDRMEVIAYVDETDIGKVRLGQTAEVTVDAFPKHKFPGKVYKISAAPTMQQNVVTYACSIRLDHYRVGWLKPQMTADVSIILQQADNLLLVPNEALKQQRGGGGEGAPGGAGAKSGGSERGKGGQSPATGGGRSTAGGGAGRMPGGLGRSGAPVDSRVLMMNNGLPEVRNITIGRTDGSFTEVLSGLKDGDTVVLAGFAELGFPEMSSSAGAPRFLTNRTPFGTASGGGAGKGGGGGARGGGGRGGGGG